MKKILMILIIVFCLSTNVLAQIKNGAYFTTFPNKSPFAIWFLSDGISIAIMANGVVLMTVSRTGNDLTFLNRDGSRNYGRLLDSDKTLVFDNFRLEFEPNSLTGAYTLIGKPEIKYNFDKDPVLALIDGWYLGLVAGVFANDKLQTLDNFKMSEDKTRVLFQYLDGEHWIVGSHIILDEDMNIRLYRFE